MEEVKVERVPARASGGKGKGGKGKKLTGLANYEARKMQRQSSVGKQQVSSAFCASKMSNDYNSPTQASENKDAEMAASPLFKDSVNKTVTEIPATTTSPLQGDLAVPVPAFPIPDPRYGDPVHQYNHSLMAEAHSSTDFENPQVMIHPAQHSQAQLEQYDNNGIHPTEMLQHTENSTPTDQQWAPISDPHIPDDLTFESEFDDGKGRSKTQMKNQKKHQRQRERKAKELRNQCMQLVVKWKLASLAAPLVSMGFAEEQCTKAVCACSDGKAVVDLERCVAWIVNEQSKSSAFSFGGDDKSQEPVRKPDIDITDEVQKMVDIESTMGISGAEVERAVLAYNGDVHSACISLSNGNNNGLMAMVH